MLDFISQTRNCSHIDAFHEAVLGLDEYIHELALRMLDVTAPLRLQLFQAFPDAHLLPGFNLIDSFLVLADGYFAVLDLLNDVLIDVLVVVVEIGVHILPLGLDLDLQVVDASD
jgi:hypothetical protein